MAGDPSGPRPHIPRETLDISDAVIGARQRFVREQTGVALDHVTRYSFDASVLPGNIEHFIGVAQVPIGIAGPLLIRGEHAQGEFLVPLATT
jgi:hydroxymethylglutaryl-CoA reductase (NADPH)